MAGIGGGERDEAGPQTEEIERGFRPLEAVDEESGRWENLDPDEGPGHRGVGAMQSIEVEVTALLERQAEAIRSKDVERLMSCFSPDIIYYDTVPPLQYVGAAALRARFLEWFDGFLGPIDLEMRDVQVRGTDDFAVAYRLSRALGTLKIGRQAGSWVRATSACQRFDRAWLVMHEHVSFAVDLQRQTVAMDLVP